MNEEAASMAREMTSMEDEVEGHFQWSKSEKLSTCVKSWVTFKVEHVYEHVLSYRSKQK